MRVITACVWAQSLLWSQSLAWSQSALERPQLGMMLEATGRVRPLFGIAGSVTLGDPAAAGVVSFACSREICLFKTRSAILSLGTEVAAPAGPALFALQGNTAFVYFPMSRQIARWHDGQLDRLAVDLTGEVLSVRTGTNGDPEFAIRRDGGTWIVNAKDQAYDSIPAARGPVMLLPGSVLYTSSSEVILRRADASEARFDVPGAQSFLTLGEGYVQIRAGRSNHGLWIAPGHEWIFLLPEPAR